MPFPPYAHVPGETPHPNKEGGHSFGRAEPECPGLGEGALADNRCFWFAADLFDHGYFWEAHVWWEAVWRRSRGDPAHDALLKGLIKIAAGRLKARMNRPDVARDLLEEARGLLRRGLGSLAAGARGDDAAWEALLGARGGEGGRLPLVREGALRRPGDMG